MERGTAVIIWRIFLGETVALDAVLLSLFDIFVVFPFWSCFADQGSGNRSGITATPERGAECI